MKKLIIAMFLSLVTVNAQQQNPEDYTRDRIRQIQSIQDKDTRNAVTKLMTEILQKPSALESINTNKFTQAKDFLLNKTNSITIDLRKKTNPITIEKINFQDFGTDITNILLSMSETELQELNRPSAESSRTWYQNVLYILWGIKFSNQLELAKKLLHIDPESLRRQQETMFASDPTLFPVHEHPQYANPPPAQQALRPTDYIAPSSLAASSPMQLPVRSVRGVQESISSNDLLMGIERNIMDRQARWKKTFIEDDKVNFMDFKSFLTPYQSLDNLIKYIKNNRITQDYNHLRNNKNPDQRVVDRVMKNYESIAAFMGEKMNGPDDREKIYQLFLSNKINILKQITFHRDRMKDNLTQWLLANKDDLRTKIDLIYREIQNEIFMDYVDVKPLSDQYSHSTESDVLSNIGTLRIADVFGISGYPYSLYFNNLKDFASRVDKFSSLMPEKGLEEKQKVMIVNEIIKTMRHMKTYHNTLTPQTKTFTYKADADGVIWNSHLLVLSLRLAIEMGLFDLLEDPSVNRDGKITMTIAQTLGHFYELLEKSHDDLLEIKLIQSRRTILEQYKNEIRTYAGAPTQLSSAASSYAATAGRSVKRERDGDGHDDPSKRFRPTDPTTAPGPAHNLRAHR